MAKGLVTDILLPAVWAILGWQRRRVEDWTQLDISLAA